MTLLFACGDTVRKVKHSSVTIANPLSALDRGYGVFQSREDYSDDPEGCHYSTLLTTSLWCYWLIYNYLRDLRDAKRWL